MALTPFHVAIPVRHLEESRRFYADVLNCEEGRCSDEWVDFNLYGHQLVIHHDPNIGEHNTLKLHHNAVDAKSVPVPHVGVVLEMEDWQQLADRLKDKGVEFVIEPISVLSVSRGSKQPCSSSTRPAMRWNSNHSKTLKGSYSPSNTITCHTQPQYQNVSQCNVWGCLSCFPVPKCRNHNLCPHR